jgi:hypothetical protein
MKPIGMHYLNAETASETLSAEFTETGDALCDGINTLGHPSSQEADPDAVGVFDSVLSQDFRDHARWASHPGVTCPLWLGSAPPPWMTGRRNEFKRVLIAVGDGWEVWINLYADRLAGDVRSDGREFACFEAPDELWAHGAARVNRLILGRSEQPTGPPASDNPEIPRPGPGPQIDAAGRPIDRAPGFGVDESGNDIRTISQLKPLAQRCAHDLRSRLSLNEFPELLATVDQYDAALNPGAGRAVEWGEVWGLGVMLQNAAASAERQIAQRLLPPLEDPAKAALARIMHGDEIFAATVA